MNCVIFPSLAYFENPWNMKWDDKYDTKNPSLRCHNTNYVHTAWALIDSAQILFCREHAGKCVMLCPCASCRVWTIPPQPLMLVQSDWTGFICTLFSRRTQPGCCIYFSQIIFKPLISFKFDVLTKKLIKQVP